MSTDIKESDNDSLIKASDNSSGRNQVDSLKRKQGIWDVKQENKITGFQTYLNDTLHGHFKYSVNYPAKILEGFYYKGMKDGIWKYYYTDTTLLMVVQWNKGSTIWHGFPGADKNFYKPSKGFYINSDSVFIECPYANNTIWYRGLYVHRKPVGIHSMFYENGNLRFETDYIKQMVNIYDSTGKLTKVKELF